jgi:hypothetical protein
MCAFFACSIETSNGALFPEGPENSLCFLCHARCHYAVLLFPCFCLAQGSYDTLTVKCVLTQRELEEVVRRHGATLAIVSLEQEHKDEAPEIHFTKTLADHLPALISLSLTCVNATVLDFSHLALKSLSLENVREVRLFNLSCPKLESLEFDFVELTSPHNLGLSLARSPLLTHLRCYKVGAASLAPGNCLCVYMSNYPYSSDT